VRVWKKKGLQFFTTIRRRGGEKILNEFQGRKRKDGLFDCAKGSCASLWAARQGEKEGLGCNSLIAT